MYVLSKCQGYSMTQKRQQIAQHVYLYMSRKIYTFKTEWHLHLQERPGLLVFVRLLPVSRTVQPELRL